MMIQPIQSAASLVRAAIRVLGEAWGHVADKFRDDNYVLISASHPDDVIAWLVPRIHSRYRRSFFPPRDPCHFSGRQRGRQFRVQLLVDFPFLEADGTVHDDPSGSTVEVRVTVPAVMRGALAGFFGLGIVMWVVAANLALGGETWPLVIFVPMGAGFIIKVLQTTFRAIGNERQALLRCLEEVLAARRT